MGQDARLTSAGSRSRLSTEVSQGPSTGPVRTCVGCRRREPAVGLVRVVRIDVESGTPALAVDLRTSMPGRGAWLHPDLDCLERAVRRRGIERALRIAGSVDLTPVRTQLETTTTT